MTAKRRPEPDPGPDLSHIAEGLRPMAMPIGTFVPDPANARLHGSRSKDEIRSSLETFGQRKNSRC